jgi:hypothetical protein
LSQWSKETAGSSYSIICVSQLFACEQLARLPETRQQHHSFEPIDSDVGPNACGGDLSEAMNFLVQHVSIRYYC